MSKSSNKLTKPEAQQLESIIDAALSKRPSVFLTINIPPAATPEEVKLTIQTIIDNFYDPPEKKKP